MQNVLNEETRKANEYIEKTINDFTIASKSFEELRESFNQSFFIVHGENEKIELNIGGENYDLKRSTLLDEETSRLASHLSSEAMGKISSSRSSGKSVF